MCPIAAFCCASCLLQPCLVILLTDYPFSEALWVGEGLKLQIGMQSWHNSLQKGNRLGFNEGILPAAKPAMWIVTPVQENIKHPPVLLLFFVQ